MSVVLGHGRVEDAGQALATLESQVEKDQSINVRVRQRVVAEGGTRIRVGERQGHR